GRARPRVLLQEDHLLLEGRAAAAVLLRPSEARPAVLPHLALPREAALEHLVLVARAAAADQGRVLAGQRLAEPPPRLRAQRLLFGGAPQAHVRRSQHVLLQPHRARDPFAVAGG